MPRNFFLRQNLHIESVKIIRSYTNFILHWLMNKLLENKYKMRYFEQICCIIAQYSCNYQKATIVCMKFVFFLQKNYYNCPKYLIHHKSRRYDLLFHSLRIRSSNENRLFHVNVSTSIFLYTSNQSLVCPIQQSEMFFRESLRYFLSISLLDILELPKIQQD